MINSIFKKIIKKANTPNFSKEHKLTRILESEYSLSILEIQTCIYLFNGYSIKEIHHTLYKDSYTLDSFKNHHLKHIYRKVLDKGKSELSLKVSTGIRNKSYILRDLLRKLVD